MDDRQPQRIGPYKILETIGEGGMGTVYLAEQSEPVRRQVALKVIKLGMDTRQVVARFEAERQALAMMDHPGIAKVLDAGATDSGRPYFVMELVKGVPITKYCDEANLAVSERIDLMRQVCDAVQHAHQKGVIHRDLKPSNVLVSVRADVPVPVIIDFGIAKATSQELTQKTLFTEAKQIVGTPEYMAPEQAEATRLDVDTRADVYSLGVILYELLTSTRPFDFHSLADKSYVELLRQIREIDPPKPSTRVKTLDERLMAVAKRRQAEPRKLGRLMRGELDWIVMKALEKERQRRYATASALADDLRRFRENLPVQAGPPSSLYRLSVAVRRNRAAVIAGAVVVLALVGGGAAALVSGHRARLAEGEARRAEGEARREARRAESVLEMIQTMLSASNVHEHKGPDYTVRELLDDFNRELVRMELDEPDVEATVRATVGEAYRSLGLFDAANRHTVRALELRRDVHGEDDRRYGDALWKLCWLRHDQGDYEEAERAVRGALRIAQSTDGAESVQAGKCLFTLADLLRHRGQLEDAEEHALRAFAIVDGGEDGLAAAQCADVVGMIYRDLGQMDRAERWHRDAVARLRDLYSGDHPAVAGALANLGSVLDAVGQAEESEASHREALEMRRRLFEPDHLDIASSLQTLSAALYRRLRFEQAEDYARESLEIYRKKLDAPDGRIGSALFNLGRIVRYRGRTQEAEQLLREAVDMRREVAGDQDHGVAVTKGALSEVLADQGVMRRPSHSRAPRWRRPKRRAVRSIRTYRGCCGDSRTCCGCSSAMSKRCRSSSARSSCAAGCCRRVIGRSVTIWQHWGALCWRWSVGRKLSHRCASRWRSAATRSPTSGCGGVRKACWVSRCSSRGNATRPSLCCELATPT